MQCWLQSDWPRDCVHADTESREKTLDSIAPMDEQRYFYSQTSKEEVLLGMCGNDHDIVMC